MTERNAIAGVVALALLVPPAASAQLVSSLEAGAVTTARDGVVPDRAISLAPGVRYDSPLFSASLRATAWRTAHSWDLAAGDLQLRAATPTILGLRAEANALANRTSHDPGMPSDLLGGQVRVVMPFRNGGVWVGGGVDRPLGIAVSSSVDVSGAGGWTQIGNSTITGSITNFQFTRLSSAPDSSAGETVSCASAPTTTSTPAPGTIRQIAKSQPAPQELCYRRSNFRDLQAGFEWVNSFVDLSAQGGYRFGSPFDVTPESRRWGSVTATFWLNGNFGTVLGHARHPASPARGLPARSLSYLGLVVAHSPVPRRAVPVAVRSIVAGFEVREAREGERTIVIRAAGIESVEIMGDFTEWEPRALTRYGRDHWQITLPLSPGVHEINVRLDHGKWRSPPGVPTRRDGFNGEVGVIVVE